MAPSAALAACSRRPSRARCRMGRPWARRRGRRCRRIRPATEPARAESSSFACSPQQPTTPRRARLRTGRR
eukprot:scaffold12992_cov58-Phaeocystis_antarctica.AAC.8